MAPAKKKVKSTGPIPEATTDYETESNISNGSGVDSPSEFDSGTPVNSTTKEPPKRVPRKYQTAELAFPCGRIVKNLRKGLYAKIIRKPAGVYLASVLEYLTGEIIANAEEQATYKKKKRITPKHIMDGIRHDHEMEELLSDVIIPGGGVLPCIHSSLKRTKNAPPKQKPAANRQLSYSSDEDE